MLGKGAKVVPITLDQVGFILYVLWLIMLDLMANFSLNCGFCKVFVFCLKYESHSSNWRHLNLLAT